MNNVQKIIIVTIIVVILLFMIAIPIISVIIKNSMGQEGITSSQQQVNDISASLQEKLELSFDGTTVTGAQVVSAVKRYYSDEVMVIRVKATKSGEICEYGKVKATGLKGDAITGYVADGTEVNIPVKFDKLSDTSSGNSAYYVPNSAKYSANLIKIAGSDDVVGIIFERK